MTSPYGAGLSGNSIAVIGDDSVLVFDSNGLPKTAKTILAQVRTITKKPVRYLVNSHWHWDHWQGNEVYLAAFPDLKIITHEKTLEQMKTVEPKWNAEGLKTQLPAYLNDLQKKQVSLKDASEIKDQQELVNAVKDFLVEKTSLHKTYPNVTFSDSMILHLGKLDANIGHVRAITIGDTYAYLPQEKVQITGDAL
jgi:glyoxylase-like metal-dependent hydrolase (beta-lactamase superfamily II)